MEPDQATFYLHALLPQVEGEWKTTRKVILAIPEGAGGYRPDPKSHTADDLAWHLAASQVWFLEGVLAGEFSMGDKEKPDEAAMPAGIVNWYERTAPPLIEKVRVLTGEELATPMSFFGLFNHPRVVYLNFLLLHAVHHRGQLSTYLRPMGGKVPSIYGGSADEPFEAPEGQ